MSMVLELDQFNGPSYGHFFTVPQDKHDKEILLAVDRKTRADVEARYNFLTDYDWHMNTIANATFEMILTTLSFMIKSHDGRTQGMGVNFFDLFVVTVSVKRNEKAEKEGNINVYFEPGPKMMELVKNGPREPFHGTPYSPLQEFSSDDPEQENFYKNLDHHTRYNLSINHGLTIKDSMAYAVFGITYIFFENLVTEMLYRLSSSSEDVADEGDQQMVSVNFNDNLEIHAVLKDGQVAILMRPGLNSKLLIKNDRMTESTMGDLEDNHD